MVPGSSGSRRSIFARYSLVATALYSGITYHGNRYSCCPGRTECQGTREGRFIPTVQDTRKGYPYHTTVPWHDPLERLRSIEAGIYALGSYACRGGDYDRWDLEVRGGIFGTARTCMAVEEHGAGKQLLRFRSWPKCSFTGLALILVFALLSIGAALAQVWTASAILGIVALLLAVRMFEECANAMATLLHVLKQPEKAVEHAKVLDRDAVRGKLETGRPQGEPERLCEPGQPREPGRPQGSPLPYTGSPD
jgi:hypothetical protein